MLYLIMFIESGLPANEGREIYNLWILVEFKTPYYTFMDMSSIRYSTAPKNWSQHSNLYVLIIS